MTLNFFLNFFHSVLKGKENKCKRNKSSCSSSKKNNNNTELQALSLYAIDYMTFSLIVRHKIVPNV